MRLRTQLLTWKLVPAFGSLIGLAVLRGPLWFTVLISAIMIVMIAEAIYTYRMMRRIEEEVEQGSRKYWT